MTEEDNKTPRFIERVKASTPTLVGEEAYKVIRGLLNPITPHAEWVLISSEILGMETAESYADFFTQSYAAIQLPEEKVYTRQPAHVMSCETPDGTIGAYGLLYSNGAVVYFEDLKGADKDLLLVWVEKSEADNAMIKYIDPSGGGFQ